MLLLVLPCLYQVSPKHNGKNKHSKDAEHKRIHLKATGNVEKSARLGFKPMQLPKNITLMLKAKGNAKKGAEYNRLRTSEKHKHKMQRKSKIASPLNASEKRSSLMEIGQLDFHLATDDKFVDQRAVKRFMDDGHHMDERPILGHCDINRQCKAEQYCEGMYCYKCRKDEEHCYANGQCCQGMECQYGYCAKGVTAGMPGTYCDKAKDCKGPFACCIFEMSVDHHNPICKPMLEEHETCGPINLFHQICSEYRAQNEPICGPCKPGLACKSVGIHGHHSICLPEGGD